MSIAHTVQLANGLSAEFLNEVRSTSTSLLEFFAHHRSTLLNNSEDGEKKSLESVVLNEAMSNYFLIY